MCGILAILCKKMPEKISTIMTSSQCLRKRGPDRCCSIYKKDGIYVFYRLCINDTTTDGDQPMKSGDKIMMCNGEIYNHKELEEKYDIQCLTGSDCEVILRLSEKRKFGDFVQELDGVFATVLVQDHNTVYIARDRFGVRPLFYGWVHESTEQKDNIPCIAFASIPESLTSYCKNIKPFPPGHYAKFTKSTGVLDFTVFAPIKLLPPVTDSYKKCIQRVHDILTIAVKKRLMTDRPIGCMLSGGLDSSVITAILARTLGGENVRTYSVGMKGSTDLYHARKVADYLHTEHREVVFTEEECFAAIPEVIKALGSYDITTIRASVGMYLISKYISENTDDKVIFSGEGSDELFCGYLYFHNAPSTEEAEKESVRLSNNLHLYDVLRADRSVSCHGLELRVPFLDKDVVDLSLQLSEMKIPDGIEKKIIREAFDSYLPHDIVWRQKCAFSDGVSSVKKSWFEYIQETVEKKLGDEFFRPDVFPSKEAMFYRLIYDKYFPTYDCDISYWMPMWCDTNDPSARTLKLCTEEDVYVISDEKKEVLMLIPDVSFMDIEEDAYSYIDPEKEIERFIVAEKKLLLETLRKQAEKKRLEEEKNAEYEIEAELEEETKEHEKKLIEKSLENIDSMTIDETGDIDIDFLKITEKNIILEDTKNIEEKIPIEFIYEETKDEDIYEYSDYQVSDSSDNDSNLVTIKELIVSVMD